MMAVLGGFAAGIATAIVLAAHSDAKEDWEAYQPVGVGAVEMDVPEEEDASEWFLLLFKTRSGVRMAAKVHVQWPDGKRAFAGRIWHDEEAGGWRPDERLAYLMADKRGGPVLWQSREEARRAMEGGMLDVDRVARASMVIGVAKLQRKLEIMAVSWGLGVVVGITVCVLLLPGGRGGNGWLPRKAGEGAG